MRTIIDSFEDKYRYYKTLGERAIDQLSDEQLATQLGDTDNSVVMIGWHIAGNLRSRFTDFMTTDGEKEWRDRESEFASRKPSRDEFLAFWESGWQMLFGTLAELGDEDLERSVVIRGQSLSVLEAVIRSLAHTSYHVGQILFLAKHIRGAAWQYASIPPGGSAAYNENPTNER